VAAEVKAVNGYSIFTGNDIDRIDEKGIYKKEGAHGLGGFAVGSTSPASTLEVLEAIVTTPAPTGFASVDIKGSKVFIMTSTDGAKKTEDPIRGVVLGEIRLNQKTTHYELIPALDIVTSKGPVTVAVDRIISLVAVPPKSGPEKKD